MTYCLAESNFQSQVFPRGNFFNCSGRGTTFVYLVEYIRRPGFATTRMSMENTIGTRRAHMVGQMGATAFRLSHYISAEATITEGVSR